MDAREPDHAHVITQVAVRALKGSSNPFLNGYKPKPNKTERVGYMRKRSLLKMMLEVDITVNDLPMALADTLRERIPGFLDNIDKKFTMYQIMELTQLQLLFSKSDYVRQDAINAIKDRVEGKPVQTVQLQDAPTEPTEFKLPNGRTIVI